MSQRKRVRRNRVVRRLRRFEFVRVLLRDRPFAVVFGIGSLIFLVLVLSIPPIWETTPREFRGPRVYVSGVDYVQVWSLSRSARRAEARGDWIGAIQAWRSALENNLADPAVHRGILQNLQATPILDLAYAKLAASSSAWLMGVTRTNRREFPLIAGVLERYGRPALALNLAKTIAAGQDDAVDRARARCLLKTGRYQEFEALWQSAPESWKSDPALMMYRDAWLVVTDDRSAGLEATTRLRDALARPGAEGVMAARLLHQVAGQKNLVDDLQRALRRLEEGNEASPGDYAELWLALTAAGRLDEARTLAQEFRQVPANADGAVRYVQALKKLGMSNEAAAFLETHAGQYALSVEVWREYLDLLVEAERWSDLRRVVADLRVRVPRHDALYGETLFAEYRQAQAEGRQRDSDELAAQVAAIVFDGPEPVVRISATFREDQRSQAALELLRANEAGCLDDPAAWNERFQAAADRRDIDEMRRAIEGLVRTKPRSPQWANNRAALLLITGENPAEALELTLAGLTRQSKSAPLRINHAIALVRNGRAAEAAELLAGIAPQDLAGDAAANYYLAMAEIRDAEKKWADLSNAVVRVDRARLFPPQRERLDQMLERARTASVH